jgi:cell division protein FtsB
MVMRWLVAILVEKMSHTALTWLRGFNGYERVVAILVEKMSHTTLSWLPACHAYTSRSAATVSK